MDPTTNSALPTTREGNLDIVYNVPGVKGLSSAFATPMWAGQPDTLEDFRLIINYELDLL